MRSFATIAAAAALTAGTLSADIKITEQLSVSGFIDMSYTSVDSPAGDEKGFSFDQAEIDFDFALSDSLSARVDLQGTDSTSIEQARIDYAMGDVT
ncbi:MAG: porin, partial [Planctomycetes bacterium]|nr:porin [Planctomycetota bacterium]